MVSFTTLLAFSAASAGALAKPVVQERQIAIPEGWTWHVSGWEAGMTRSGSYYRFNVTVPRVESETTNIAGVTAFCEGRENGWYRKGNWYENCRIIYGSNNGVAAKLSERESDVDGYPREILISFEYGAYGDRPAYNFTGKAPMIYNAAVAPAQEFDVKPTEVFGVA